MKKHYAILAGMVALGSFAVNAQSPLRVKQITETIGEDEVSSQAVFHYANSTQGFIQSNLPKLELHRFGRYNDFSVQPEFGYGLDMTYMSPPRFQHIGIDFNLTDGTFSSPLCHSNVTNTNGYPTFVQNTSAPPSTDYNFRATYQYDSQNRLTFILLESEDNGVYDTTQTHEYTYLNGIEHTHKLTYFDENGPSHYYKDSMIYNGSNQLTELYYIGTLGNSYYVHSRHFNYDLNLLDETVSTKTSDGQLLEQSKTIWYNNSVRLTAGFTIEWDGTNFGDTLESHQFTGITTHIDSYLHLYNYSSNQGRLMEFEYLNDNFLSEVNIWWRQDGVDYPENHIVYSYQNNLGLEANGQQDFDVNIFPNPTSDYLSITSDQSIQEVSVYNLSGQLLLKQKSTKKLDLRHLAAGTYQVVVQGNLSAKTFSVVKN